jgi:hypothetical protein
VGRVSRGKAVGVRPLNSIVRHQAMSDLAGLSTWGVVAGSIAGIVLHFNVAPGRRSSIVRWCLLFGGAALAFFVLAAVGGIDPGMGKGVLGLGFVGFPALVAGLLMAGLGFTPRHAQAGNKETPGV